MADLITRAELKLALNIATAVTGDDDYFDQLISLLSKDIEDWCGTIIAADTVTEVHDGPGVFRLVTYNAPILTVSSLHESLEGVFDTSSLIASADYLVDQREGAIVLVGGATFGRDPQSVQVVMTAGYTTVPNGIKYAVLEEAAEAYHLREKHGKASVASGDVSVAYRSPEERDRARWNRLGKYRRMRMRRR